MNYQIANYRRLALASAIVFSFFFCLCVFFYERYEYDKAYSRIEQHGVVISNALWNLSPEGADEYLSLACKSHNYKTISVFDTKGRIFKSADGNTNGWSESIFTFLHLMPEVLLQSDVIYDGTTIGTIKAIWKCNTIYQEIYLLFALILLYFICYLNIRLLKAKNLLEQKVKLRTMELSIVNSSLKFEVEEHRQAREALLKSEEHYRILIENIPDILYRTDMEGKILFISPSCEGVSGYNAEELIGKDVSELFYLDPAGRKDFFSMIQKSGYVSNYEEKLKKKDGTIWWASTNAHFFKDSGGNIAGIEGVYRDVTSKKLLENELRQAQKMESIGTLTGGIAHDFNNILNIMLGNAELAIEDIPQSSPAHAKVESIRAAGHKASGIVKQLLSFGRKTDMELKPIDIVPIIRESIHLLRATIPVSIKIIENIPPDMDAVVLGHSTQIHQIIINLCINASHAMETVEGAIVIKVEKVLLEPGEYGIIGEYDGTGEYIGGVLEYAGTGEHVKITVSDTGPGIPSDIIDKIFDPYFTTKKVDKGTGMGLAVVHGIVKNHNGAITVSSNPPEGATFTVLLPIVTHEITSDIDNEEERQPTEIEPKADVIYYGTERILLVDDDEFIVEMTNEMLERLGYKVESKSDPEEALELFMANPDAFDLIITDMTMPQMTGAKLAERVRAIRSDIPVILCSGYSALINEEKAKEIGIAAYMMKPVSMQDLGFTIQNVLKRDKNVI
ncbi:MAG: response regulator [Desulfamplus sp.]|nr:response regulator [Desulfamplus sp.]